jgi:cytochrome c oxidase subunit II
MAPLLHEASDTAVLVDRALVFVIGTSVAILAIVTSLMVFFVVKYNRKRHPRAENPNREGGRLMEFAWAVLATLLVLLMFWFGWRDFTYLRNPPRDALPVLVTGNEWIWRFTYENGKESSVLKVPLDRPVRLAMTSLDVIHSVYIPAFRIKEDVVPGMTTHLWFTPTQSGSYDLFCTEYCGVGHSHMRTTVEVLPLEAFNRWLAGGSAAAEQPAGLGLLEEKGCLGCHSTDGSSGVGPTLRGLFGGTVVVLTGGVERRLQADEEYLRRSILEPHADLARGFGPIMPAVPLTKAELDATVAAIESLKETPR